MDRGQRIPSPEDRRCTRNCRLRLQRRRGAFWQVGRGGGHVTADGYKIGVRGCQHLGYAARNMRLDRTTGWNQRVVDGHIAHGLIMHDMINAGVDGIVDGGDLSHWNKPVPRDIAIANRVDDLRVSAGTWAIATPSYHRP